MATIKRYTSPHAYRNLDAFVEQLPVRASYAAVAAGAASLVLACLAVTYVVIQANTIMTLRADILKAEALKPTVPVINKVAVDNAEVQNFVKKIKDFYPQLNFATSGGRIDVTSPAVDKYGAFREVVGHLFNGGKGWRVAVESMCVGRECKNNMPIQGSFSIHRLRVDKPAG